MVKIQGGEIRATRRPLPTQIPPRNHGIPAVVAEVRGDGEASLLRTDANQLANFAPNEIAIPGGATTAPPDIAELIGTSGFEDDLQRADRQQGHALYAGWREKLTESLGLAYPLYLHVLLDPEKLKRLFEAPYFSGSRQRVLPKTKVALAALQYVTKPSSEDERKSASAYANMLICARHKGVTADRFPAEMAGITLRQARTFVRNLPQKKGPVPEEAPANPTLTFIYRSERRVLQDVSFSTDTERQKLAERIVGILHELQD